MSEVRQKLIVEAVEGCEPEIGRMLWCIEDSRTRTLKELEGSEGMPQGWVDLRGPVGANTLGTVLYHLALIEASWLYEDALGVEIPAELMELFPVEDRDEAGVLMAMKGHRLESYLERLAAVRGRLLEAYKGMSVEDFRRVRSLPGYDVSPEWVLHHLMQHEAEHRGQIQVIMESLRGQQ